MEYSCPICRKTMTHDLLDIIAHGDEHVVEKVKEKHPEWASSDGMCKKCYEYYKQQIHQDKTF